MKSVIISYIIPFDQKDNDLIWRRSMGIRYADKYFLGAALLDDCKWIITISVDEITASIIALSRTLAKIPNHIDTEHLHSKTAYFQSRFELRKLQYSIDNDLY